MTSFMLENAYLNYMMQVVNDTTKIITADVIIANSDYTIRDLYGTGCELRNAGEIADRIERELPGYETSIRVTAQGTYGIGAAGEGADACSIQGIDPLDDSISDIRSKIVEGRFFKEDDPILRGHTPFYIKIRGPGSLPDFTYGTGQRLLKNEKPYPIIVGATAAKLHPSLIKVGKTLDLTISMSGRETSYAGITVKIIGLYESGTPTLDAIVWFMHVDSLREIKGYGNITGRDWYIPGVGTFRGFNPIEIDRKRGDVVLVKAPEPFYQLDPIGYSEEVKKKICSIVPNLKVFSWHDFLVYIAGSMQDVVTLMVWGSMAVTLFLCGATIKYVMDSIILRKTREIGSLKAFGARDRLIFKIFLYQGLFIGIIAGVVGIIVSVIVMNLVSWYGLSMEFIAGTQLDLGFIVNWITILVALLLPIILSVLAAAFPAKKAAGLSPVEALRKGELSL